MIGPKYVSELEPYQTVFTLGIWNSLFLGKLYVFSCLTSKSQKSSFREIFVDLNSFMTEIPII